MQADNFILFDGSCAFCNGFIRRVIRADRGRFSLCDQQSPLFSALMQQYGLAAPQAQQYVLATAHEPPPATGPGGAGAGTIYLLQRGCAYTRTAAVARILCGCRWPYPLAGWLLRCIPAFISNPAYNWVARRRHRLLPEKACPLPSPAMRKRLLQ